MKKSKKLRMDKYDVQLWCEDNILGLLDVDVKIAFFLIQFEFSSSDKEIEEKVKKIGC